MPIAPKQHYVKPVSKFIALEVELQIPSDIHTQKKKRGYLWKNQKRISQDIPRTGQAKGKPNNRRLSKQGSCPYVH